MSQDRIQRLQHFVDWSRQHITGDDRHLAHHPLALQFVGTLFAEDISLLCMFFAQLPGLFWSCRSDTIRMQPNAENH